MHPEAVDFYFYFNSWYVMFWLSNFIAFCNMKIVFSALKLIFITQKMNLISSLAVVFSCQSYFTEIVLMKLLKLQLSSPVSGTTKVGEFIRYGYNFIFMHHSIFLGLRLILNKGKSNSNNC